MRSPLHFSLLLAVCAVFGSRTANAQVIGIPVGNEADFAQAIIDINNNPTGDYRLVFGANVTLSSPVRPIELTTGSLTVVGDGHSIDGGGVARPFFIESGAVRIENLTIAGGLAQGGGGTGAGGGLGAGAAIFVDVGGELALKNVQFTNNAAIGGGGGAAGTGGGGGGLGGSGAGGTASGAGGGGGLYGAGGVPRRTAAAAAVVSSARADRPTP